MTLEQGAGPSREELLSTLKLALSGLTQSRHLNPFNVDAEISQIEGTIARLEWAEAFTTRRVVVLSTEHVPRATWHALEGFPLESWCVSGGRICYGFYIRAHPEASKNPNCPSELAAVLEWAAREGFEYIQFDRDEDPREELPVFDQGAGDDD